MVNRRARYNYEILEEFPAGIVLTGPEIKSLRQGLSNINDSYCLIINNEVFIDSPKNPTIFSGWDVR
jgi:SsrA-binding protein